MTISALNPLRPVRAALDEQIGPRRPGAIYQTSLGQYEVLVLITDPAEAAQLLRRDAAQWALIVRDVLRPDGQPYAIGDVWTMSDYLVRSAPATAAYAPVA
ncbi:hypothetical protein [Streptomyces sp. NPDC051561]|uniref:hypothetical protein n=1 Tax=Streptomyces sp. NPDC051561 TaxID=3365658 RepID=UPI0037A42C4B